MSVVRFPALPHLGLGATDVDFRHARGLDMFQYVARRSWSYEPDVLASLLCLVRQHGPTRFVNVGANMGYFAILVKKLFGDQVDVHAYEPMPELHERLHAARRHNDIDIHVSGAALADFEGTAPFHLSARSDTSNSLNPDFRPAKEVIDVPVTTLDAEFVDGASEDSPGATTREVVATVLLIDTESTEPAVLRGGLTLIERDQPAIICEVLAGRTEDGLSSIVSQIGYEAYALTDDGPERRSEIVGDRTYRHRDWIFLPRGHPGVSTECVSETVRVLAAASG